jgi:hypothetical protein
LVGDNMVSHADGSSALIATFVGVLTIFAMWGRAWSRP